MMRIRIVILALLLGCCPLAARQSRGVQLFDAAIRRDVPPGQYVYNWRDAVLLKAFTDIGRSVPARHGQVVDYAAEVMERVAPKAHGVHPNGIASAMGFAFLMEEGRATEATAEALDRVYEQYLAIRRTSEGGCSHRTSGTELWDDTLYMLEIFLLELYRATGDRKYMDQCVMEVSAHAIHLRDAESGLWYHGWAENAQ